MMLFTLLWQHSPVLCGELRGRKLTDFTGVRPLCVNVRDEDVCVIIYYYATKAAQQNTKQRTKYIKIMHNICAC